MDASSNWVLSAFVYLIGQDSHYFFSSKQMDLINMFCQCANVLHSLLYEVLPANNETLDFEISDFNNLLLMHLWFDKKK